MLFVWYPACPPNNPLKTDTIIKSQMLNDRKIYSIICLNLEVFSKYSTSRELIDCANYATREIANSHTLLVLTCVVAYNSGPRYTSRAR